MMPTKQPRTGRQIPEWMVLSVAFSLSTILGTPLAARLRLSYPEANKVMLFAVGLAFGFLLLVAIWALFAFFFTVVKSIAKKRRER